MSDILVTKPGTPEREFIESVKNDLEMSDYQVKKLIINFREYLKFKMAPKINITPEQAEKLASNMKNFGVGVIEVSHDDQIIEANKLIETVAMYGRINHDRPRDYRELCQDYLKKYLPGSGEIQ